MAREKLYKRLENEFASTFLEELIPGMLHNFANPLNGIMGRSRLLQQRLDDCFEYLKREHPEVSLAMESDLKKLTSDTNLIVRETDRFYDLFRNVSRKFFALSSKSDQSVNLAELVEEEIRFADCYLDFKHLVNRNVSIERESLPVPGVLAHYSIAFSSLLLYAMKRMAKSPIKEIRIVADRQGPCMRLTVIFTGEYRHDRLKNIMDSLNLPAEGGDDPNGGDEDGLLISCLALFREYGARCCVDTEEGKVRVEILFPGYHPQGKEAEGK